MFKVCLPSFLGIGYSSFFAKVSLGSSSSSSSSSTSSSKSSQASNRSNALQVSQRRRPAQAHGRQIRGVVWGPDAGRPFFRLTPKDGRGAANPSWQMTCLHPRHQEDTKSCTRTRSYAGPEQEQIVLRKLKSWALKANDMPDHASHKALKDPAVRRLPSMETIEEAIGRFEWQE